MFRNEYGREERRMFRDGVTDTDLFFEGSYDVLYGSHVTGLCLSDAFIHIP